jgi:pimeloyl-ACP methyl ester carboxylesterase
MSGTEDVAQEPALVRPRLIRRLVLAGTAPRGASADPPLVRRRLRAGDAGRVRPDRFITLFFSGSEESRAKGMQYLARISAHTVAGRQRDNDTMMITENSHLLAHHLPNAQLRISPDAGHGFLNQYPELVADHVNAFLNGGWRSPPIT